MSALSQGGNMEGIEHGNIWCFDNERAVLLCVCVYVAT